uniref:Uncharacterized protein n=1 Tax=Ananas comosus var. bracteatus TaxID=296719 RepID=A0A6V7P788_ANACO|nr:unnamed protein product [Ananas comosus var. bracteatus]
MKGGGLLKLTRTNLFFMFIILIFTTVIIWARERTPLVTPFQPSLEHFDVLSPEYARPQLSVEDDSSVLGKLRNSLSEDAEATIGTPSVEISTPSSTEREKVNEDLKEDLTASESEKEHEDLKKDLRATDSEKEHENLEKDLPLKKDCNFAKGKWIKDKKRPLYSGFGCRRWLSEMWACRVMKRPDFSYENFRWKPENCEMPEFTGHEFLKRMRHKTIAFVGDSLGRQQFQSLMCMVTGGKTSLPVEDSGREFGLVKARGAIRPNGWAYRFPSSNTTILFYWSASLCELQPLNKSNPATNYAMHLDRPVTFLKQFLDRFDVLILNTGHHWNRGKFKTNRWEMYVNGTPNTNKRLAEIGNAKNLTIYSIVRWLDSELLRRPKLKAFFRTLSPRHFVNGDWNTGGSCDNTVPLAGGSEVVQDGSSDIVTAGAVNGTRVKILDITALSKLRDEAHISKYSAKSLKGVHDCLHWCLPGVPDAWNEILFAQL